MLGLVVASRRSHHVADSVRSPFVEHAARVLVLIDAHTTPRSGIKGWDTLARADFLLRYPTVLARIFDERGTAIPDILEATATEQQAAEGLPLRFKFGPWDAAYYPVVGRLVGTGLVQRSWKGPRIELRATTNGHSVVEELRGDDWSTVLARARLLGTKLRLSAGTLTDVIESAIDYIETSESAL